MTSPPSSLYSLVLGFRRRVLGSIESDTQLKSESRKSELPAIQLYDIRRRWGNEYTYEQAQTQIHLCCCKSCH